MYLPATVKSHARLRIVEAELDFHSLSSFSSCLSILSFVTYCCNVVAHLIITAENFSPWRSSILVISLSTFLPSHQRLVFENNDCFFDSSKPQYPLLLAVHFMGTYLPALRCEPRCNSIDALWVVARPVHHSSTVDVLATTHSHTAVQVLGKVA